MNQDTRPTVRRTRPTFDQPERFTYEAAVLARNPRLGRLLAADVEGFRGGAR
jgi:hypothetical protein